MFLLRHRRPASQAHWRSWLPSPVFDRDHGGPGILLGEIVTYWAAPGAPSIAVNPEDVDFDVIGIGESVTRHVTIAGSGFPSSFDWVGVNTIISPGGSFQLTIDFSPLAAGEDRATVPVESNAPGSPPRVALHGKHTEAPPWHPAASRRPRTRCASSPAG